MKKIIKIVPHSGQNGIALPLALVSIVILLVMGTGLLELGVKARILTIRSTSEISARCAADAGLTQALYEMNNRLKVKPWNGDFLPTETGHSLPNSSATYSFYVTGDIVSGYNVVSIGTCGANQKQVVCDLKLQGPFECAIFVEENIELKNSASVDWYNNQTGDEPMQVATNSILPGSVILKNSSYINGDVVVGAKGNPDSVISDFGATITGETGYMLLPRPIVSVTVPDSLSDLPSGGTLKNNTIITSSAKYDSINLKNSKTITIEGDVSLYITGDIILGNSAEIEIEEDSSLILYLGGNFEGKNSSTINNETQIPKNWRIYALDSCESIVLKNSSDFYGTIYAPNAEVTMDNSADMHGSIVAKNFDQKNSGDFNYDASLRDVSSDDEMVSFVIANWSEQ